MQATGQVPGSLRLYSGEVSDATADKVSDPTGEPVLDPASLRNAELEERVASLQIDLWGARDAVIGATAAVGTQRAKVHELEHLCHLLRMDIERLQLNRTRQGRVVDRVVLKIQRFLA